MASGGLRQRPFPFTIMRKGDIWRPHEVSIHPQYPIQTAVIDFFTEDIDFTPTDCDALAEWVAQVVESEGRLAGAINYIFCSDEYLLQMNREHLQHDYYTDIITFDYCEGTVVSGDLFISVDRVRENASGLGVPFDDELHRVMVHGVLHLLGYSDKEETEKAAMREMEDRYLGLR